MEAVDDEMKLQRVGYGEAFGEESFDDVVFKYDVFQFHFATFGDGELGTLELDGVHLKNSGGLIRFFFEILIDDI